MGMSIKGQLYKIGQTEEVTDRFSKREFAISIQTQYGMNFVKFELQNQKCDLIEEFRVGDFLEVSFDFKGRAWTGKDGKETIFNTIVAWKIERVGQNQSAAEQPKQQPAKEEQVPATQATKESDDLPF